MSSLEFRVLQALAPWRAAPAWRVAFSGGLDSSVLLHLLVRLAAREQLPPISAIHVHHGLQPAADAWVEACQRSCAALGIALQVCRVQVAAGASLERAARNARYTALSAQLQPEEVLLTAQHRDDQAETLLFRLLRGAGVLGLAAMPTQRVLGAGMLLRPLLDCRRAELEDYARAHALTWEEDPSNIDQRHARNYLRHQVMPVLQQRWPQTAVQLARSAAHCREAQQLLEELAQLDLQAAGTPAPHAWLECPSLDIQVLAALNDARQRNALRHWLGMFTAQPDSDHWAGWLALRDAASDARPLWVLGGGVVHRAGGRIWWLAGAWLQPPVKAVHAFNSAQVLSLPGNGKVWVEGMLPHDSPLQVRYRQPGEVLELPGRGHRDLKRWLNEQDVPVFVRERLPLLCAGDRVLAVANLPALNRMDDAGWRFVWQPASG